MNVSTRRHFASCGLNAYAYARYAIVLGMLGVALSLAVAAEQPQQVAGAGAGSLSPDLDFQRDVVPILSGRCLECHNHETHQAGLDLSSAETLRRGGESGPAIGADLNSADVTSEQAIGDNLLWQRIVNGEMPPEARGQTQRLPDREIDVLRRWLLSGAPWPDGLRLSIFDHTSHLRAGRDWWSLQPVRRPSIPQGEAVGPQASDRSPIDAFVAAQLTAHGLRMAPPADKRSLLRRVYFDVWGLPPTWEQMQAFEADERPDAWSRVVDQLLASPHYGERWARHWLDVVRFAETCGYERDQLKPGIWKYRDWVIRAFNDDLPYDQFVSQQLAGDEVPERTEQTVIATGMLRAGTWNDEPNDPADYLYERLEDMVHVTSTAFLGLTVKCARCHDHKFDPIAQTDYYRFGSFFWAGPLGQASLGGPTSEQLGFDVFGWTDKAREVEPIHLLVKGERLRVGPQVEPGFLSAVPQLDQPLTPPPVDSPTTTRRLQLTRWMTHAANPLTARVMVNRLWLHHFGQGLVRTPDNFGFKGELPTHPQLLDWLAAELMTPTDSHVAPWSLKNIHRQILLSETYRQASVHPDQSHCLAVDGANRYWWHHPRHRLDAESLRDAMLSVSGQLNVQMGGESFYPHMSHEALEGLSRKSDAWKESSASQQQRRSVYMITVRSRVLPWMTAFDFCDTTRPCGQRDVTIVPTQALALLNNDFVHQQSTGLARRIQAESPQDVTSQIELAWRLTLGRDASQFERRAALEHIREQVDYFAASSVPNCDEELEPDALGIQDAAANTTLRALASLCHVLLNCNEFIYLD